MYKRRNFGLGFAYNGKEFLRWRETYAKLIGACSTLMERLYLVFEVFQEVLVLRVTSNLLGIVYVFV